MNKMSYVNYTSIKKVYKHTTKTKKTKNNKNKNKNKDVIRFMFLKGKTG